METTLKLNYKRTFIIGFAFFGILLLWQVYDSWCPSMLTELFKESLGKTNSEEVQYLVGMVMALDNLAALILLPIFGALSDKTNTKIGKRMPFILVGTFVCAIAFPFIPVFFHYNNLIGTIIMMGIVVLFAMMYRNPAVALMPDITPKPLRSKANGIINIMGYIGGAFATVVGIVFVLSNYLNSEVKNIWTIEMPFIIASVLMLISAFVLFFSINENKIKEEIKDELELGERMSETIDKVDDDKPLSKANTIMLLCILVAEFFWFMADNGVGTFMVNYVHYYFGAKTSYAMINTIIGGVGSVIGFAIGGSIAAKIGRKRTVLSGLGITMLAYLTWFVLGVTVFKSFAQTNPNTFPPVIYGIWFLKGFGMSLVHVNSFPMVVELCNSKKIGKYTGYYYTASMLAQTVTPTLLGLLLLSDSFDWSLLPQYAFACMLVSFIVFMFVKNVKTTKTDFKKGIEALDAGD